MNIKRFAAPFVAIVSAAAGRGASASPEVVATFTFDDLAGSHNGATHIFTARAVDNAILQSSGDVSRLIAPAGNASFDAGFLSLPDQADFVFTCAIVLTGQFTATGTGSFVSTDINGDTITGSFDGIWGRPAAGFIHFQWQHCSVQFNPSANGIFEGSAGGAWDMSLPTSWTLSGETSPQIVFGGSSFFATDFSNRAVGVTMQIVPAPGALALIGLGAGLRRRAR